MSAMDAKEMKEKVAALRDNPKVMLAVVAVVVLLDLGFVVRWQAVSLGRMATDARKLKADIKLTRQESKNAGQYDKNRKEMKIQQDRLRGMIVASEGLPMVLETISKYANVCGVRILRIQPVDDLRVAALKPTDEMRRQKISIAANAGFHALGRFIAMLEGDRIFMDIRSLEIRADQTEYTRQQISIVLEVLQRNV